MGWCHLELLVSHVVCVSKLAVCNEVHFPQYFHRTQLSILRKPYHRVDTTYRLSPAVMSHTLTLSLSTWKSSFFASLCAASVTSAVTHLRISTRSSLHKRPELTDVPWPGVS